MKLTKEVKESIEYMIKDISRSDKFDTNEYESPKEKLKVLKDILANPEKAILYIKTPYFRRFIKYILINPNKSYKDCIANRLKVSST